MRKGELPIPYIVGLILAVLIIAGLGYMFYKENMRFNVGADYWRCQAAKSQYCLEVEQDKAEPYWPEDLPDDCEQPQPTSCG